MLHALQIELVKLQRHFIGCDDKILILLEGNRIWYNCAGVERVMGFCTNTS